MPLPLPRRGSAPEFVAMTRHGGVGPPGSSARPVRLLDRVREAVRVRHYSVRTEQAYLGCIRRFILFHGKRHPQEMGASEVAAFLSSLAVERHVSAATQNQALHALLFLYRVVLDRPNAGPDLLPQVAIEEIDDRARVAGDVVASGESAR